ncbi:MAG: type II toxin-antitoxin system RelE/ParE family toxin [Mucilaginibacter sp.]|uniref:type II toxin-antitoxin system RelE/ParE family toxin n=1 Tax=Mucilaginibacter sp. TaxID=1882438 RepID=UPI003265C8C2
MYTVKLLHEAEIEIANGCEWYEEQQKGLAKRFLKEVDYYLALLRKNPLQFNVRFSEKFRFATLQVFPYTIAYKIDEVDKIVYVNAIFHTSQNPIRF